MSAGAPPGPSSDHLLVKAAPNGAAVAGKGGAETIGLDIAGPEEALVSARALVSALAAGAPPVPPPGRGAIGPRQILALQRLAGNAAVNRLLRRQGGAAVRDPEAPIVQRDNPAPQVHSVTGVSLSASRISVPVEAGLSLKASASPTNTDATFSVDKGSAEATGVTIAADTGVIAVASSQPGGSVQVTATSSDGASATTSLQIIEKPTGIASTTAAAFAKKGVYGGQFTHTLSAASGKSSGLEGANINEKFDSLTAQTPFGAFTLTANAAGSRGWDLDSNGTMAGPDNVSIGSALVDIGQFTKSASNSSPKGPLPQGFTMTQHLHAKSFPSGNLDAAPFADVSHIRTLDKTTQFVVSAGKDKTSDDYAGNPARTNATATPASVPASSPKPKAGRGAAATAWARSKSQVSADAIPVTAKTIFAIRGPKLDCEIDASSGEVLIGDQAGTVTVRVSSDVGPNFDEATITVTTPPPPSASP